ncbi:glycine/betaine ABC transporter ATP-binding protein, partial [Methylobacterium radiotolerans]
RRPTRRRRLPRAREPRRLRGHRRPPHPGSRRPLGLRRPTRRRRLPRAREPRRLRGHRRPPHPGSRRP